MSVKQVSLGNLKRKLCKIKEIEFPLLRIPSNVETKKTKTVGIWRRERSNCPVTKLYDYSETKFSFLKVNIEVKCV